MADKTTTTTVEEKKVTQPVVQPTLTPSYSTEYSNQLNDLYNQMANRAPFSYNANDDQMYQQYLARYQQMGKQAMQDTMGQTAALTGGYANSYAQNVGQQAYDSYLQQANDAVTDYYNMALGAYNAEGDRLGQLFNLAGTMDETYYNRLYAEAEAKKAAGDDSLWNQLFGIAPKKKGGGGGWGYTPGGGDDDEGDNDPTTLSYADYQYLRDNGQSDQAIRAYAFANNLTLDTGNRIWDSRYTNHQDYLAQQEGVEYSPFAGYATFPTRTTKITDR